jgi:hypothetical protein
LAPADRVVPIPAGISFEQAAAVMLQGMTAHYLSHSAYPIQADDGKRFPSDLSKSGAIEKTADGFTYLDPARFHAT